MKPLLEITTVPIVLEYKVNRARLEKVNSNAVVELSRSDRGVRARSRPIRMNIDSLERRRGGQMPRVSGTQNNDNKVTMPPANIATSPPRRRPNAAGAPNNNATYSASARVLDNGNIQIDMQFSSEAVEQISAQFESARDSAKFISDYPNPEFSPQDFSVTYEIDKMIFDRTASMRNIELEFVPADLEFSILEYPSVTIEYVGEPIYVPPSANPNAN